MQTFDAAQLGRIHSCRAADKVIDGADYPPEEITFQRRTPTWVPHQEAEIGFTTTEVVAELLLGNGLFLLRAAHGVLSLAGKHGLQRRKWAYAWAAKSASEVSRLQGILSVRAEVGAAVVDVDGGAACGVLSQLFVNVAAPPTPSKRDPDYLRGVHHGQPPARAMGRR